MVDSGESLLGRVSIQRGARPPPLAFCLIQRSETNSRFAFRLLLTRTEDASVGVAGEEAPIEQLRGGGTPKSDHGELPHGELPLAGSPAAVTECGLADLVDPLELDVRPHGSRSLHVLSNLQERGRAR